MDGKKGFLLVKRMKEVILLSNIWTFFSLKSFLPTVNRNLSSSKTGTMCLFYGNPKVTKVYSFREKQPTVFL